MPEVEVAGIVVPLTPVAGITPPPAPAVEVAPVVVVLASGVTTAVPMRFSTGATVSGVDEQPANAAETRAAKASEKIGFIGISFGYDASMIGAMI